MRGKVRFIRERGSSWGRLERLKTLGEIRELFVAVLQAPELTPETRQGFLEILEGYTKEAFELEEQAQEEARGYHVEG